MCRMGGVEDTPCFKHLIGPIENVARLLPCNPISATQIPQKTIASA